MGMPLPPIQGLSRTLSEPADARQKAKAQEAVVQKQEEDEWKRTRKWSDEQQQNWDDRRRELEEQWEEALRLSYAAEHDFTDRYG